MSTDSRAPIVDTLASPGCDDHLIQTQIATCAFTALIRPADPLSALTYVSDGQQSAGAAPDLRAGYPVMTCALGPQANQLFLQQIAQRSGGQYFYAPRAADLMKVYNKVLARSAQASLLVNQLTAIAHHECQLIPLVVPQRPGSVQVSVVWSDPAIRYRADSAQRDELAVNLVEPSGAICALKPSQVGAGFVIFTLDAPTAGQWYIQLDYSGRAPSLLCTGAALHYPAPGRSGLAPLSMNIELASLHRVGQPLPLTLHVQASGEVLSNVRAHALVLEPGDGARDSLAPRQRIVHLQGSAGEYRGWLDTPVGGSYSVQLQVGGESQASGPFQCSDLAGVLVLAAH